MAFPTTIRSSFAGLVDVGAVACCCRSAGKALWESSPGQAYRRWTWGVFDQAGCVFCTGPFDAGEASGAHGEGAGLGRRELRRPAPGLDVERLGPTAGGKPTHAGAGARNGFAGRTQGAKTRALRFRTWAGVDRLGRFFFPVWQRLLIPPACPPSLAQKVNWAYLRQGSSPDPGEFWGR